MAFDRLIRGVDEWAGARQRRDIFAQIGPSDYRPKHIRHSQFIDPAEFMRNIQAADAIVAHAGMGSIISAVELGKPILVMPRRGDLGETRNDHQIATAERFSSLRLVDVAADEQELLRKLDGIDRFATCGTACRNNGAPWSVCPFDHDDEDACEHAGHHACPHLLMALSAFFDGRSPLDVVTPIEMPFESQLASLEPVEVNA